MCVFERNTESLGRSEVPSTDPLILFLLFNLSSLLSFILSSRLSRFSGFPSYNFILIPYTLTFVRLWGAYSTNFRRNFTDQHFIYPFNGNVTFFNFKADSVR